MHTTLLVGTLLMLTGFLLADNDTATGIKSVSEKFAGEHGKKLEHAAAGALSNVVRRIDRDTAKVENAAERKVRKAAHAARRDAEKKIRGQAVKTEIMDGAKPEVAAAPTAVPPAADVVPPTEEITKPVLPPIDAPVNVATPTDAPVKSAPPADPPAKIAPPTAAPVKVETAVAAVPTPAPAPAAAAAMATVAAPAPPAEQKAEPARKKWWKFWSKD